MKNKGSAIRRFTALIVLLCGIAALAGGAGAPEASAASVSAKNDIRVGLESLYTGKGELTVSDTKLGMGYCIDSAYQMEETLYGRNGFVITPDRQYYYRSAKTYGSFLEAKRAAAAVQESGRTALPVTVGRKCWRVYACGAETAEAAKKEAGSREAEKDTVLIGGVPFFLEPERSAYTIRIAGDEAFLADAQESLAYPQFYSLTADRAGVYRISLGERSYRGRLEFGRYGKSALLSAVNVVPLEEYLLGVVPCEMPSAWPMEALKAQAVCARSFALKKAGYRSDTNLARGYYMSDTVSSQAYGGYGSETERAGRAVEATAGETVCYDNKTVMAYYFSTSGGRTEDAEDVWGSALPYLQGVVDLYETAPAKEPWVIAMTAEELASAVASGGMKTGRVTDLLAEIRTASGRVYSLKVKGTGGAVTLQGSSVRETLALPSTKFKLVRYGETPDMVTLRGAQGTRQERISGCYIIDGTYQVRKADSNLEQYIVRSADNLTNFPQAAPSREGVYYFAGMGFGHGIGMSQSGARGMADAGCTYRQIIAFYFSGAQVR